MRATKIIGEDSILAASQGESAAYSISAGWFIRKTFRSKRLLIDVNISFADSNNDLNATISDQAMIVSTAIDERYLPANFVNDDGFSSTPEYAQTTPVAEDLSGTLNNAGMACKIWPLVRGDATWISERARFNLATDATCICLIGEPIPNTLVPYSGFITGASETNIPVYLDGELCAWMVFEGTSSSGIIDINTVEYWEYRDSNGENPLFDINTGARIPV